MRGSRKNQNSRSHGGSDSPPIVGTRRARAPGLSRRQWRNPLEPGLDKQSSKLPVSCGVCRKLIANLLSLERLSCQPERRGAVFRDCGADP